MYAFRAYVFSHKKIIHIYIYLFIDEKYVHFY